MSYGEPLYTFRLDTMFGSEVAAREARMTKEEVDKALVEMERLREASRIADDIDEQRQHANDYHRLWRKVRPYIDGEVPYSEKN